MRCLPSNYWRHEMSYRAKAVFLFCLYFVFRHKTVCSQIQFDGGRGLKRGINARGLKSRVSYGNFVVDKFHRLQVSVGSSSVVSNYRECALSCVNNPSCSSFNVASSPRSDGKFRCELLNEDKYFVSAGQLVSSQEYHHYSIKTPCSSFPCQNNATCVPDYSENQYQCDCLPGYDGKFCQTAQRSCKEVYDFYRSNISSQQVTLNVNGQPTSVYCHMGDFGCGDGGWTTVMKIDGNKKTFQFSNAYWTNQNEYNPQGGQTGFDLQETKLRTYWSTSFSKICLGMKINQQTRFIVLNKQASSLYSLIADGTHRATFLGRDKWITLIGSQVYLQGSCNREGFNVISGDPRHKRARVGILGNNENDCHTCDSRIGFGTAGLNDDITCGSNGVKAMGYIFVQ